MTSSVYFYRQSMKTGEFADGIQGVGLTNSSNSSLHRYDPFKDVLRALYPVKTASGDDSELYQGFHLMGMREALTTMRIKTIKGTPDIRKNQPLMGTKMAFHYRMLRSIEDTLKESRTYSFRRYYQVEEFDALSSRESKDDGKSDVNNCLAIQPAGGANIPISKINGDLMKPILGRSAHCSGVKNNRPFAPITRSIQVNKHVFMTVTAHIPYRKRMKNVEPQLETFDLPPVEFRPEPRFFGARLQHRKKRARRLKIPSLDISSGFLRDKSVVCLPDDSDPRNELGSSEALDALKIEEVVESGKSEVARSNVESSCGAFDRSKGEGATNGSAEEREIPGRLTDEVHQSLEKEDKKETTYPRETDGYEDKIKVNRLHSRLGIRVGNSVVCSENNSVQLQSVPKSKPITDFKQFCEWKRSEFDEIERQEDILNISQASLTLSLNECEFTGPLHDPSLLKTTHQLDWEPVKVEPLLDENGPNENTEAIMGTAQEEDSSEKSLQDLLSSNKFDSLRSESSTVSNQKSVDVEASFSDVDRREDLKSGPENIDDDTGKNIEFDVKETQYDPWSEEAIKRSFSVDAIPFKEKAENVLAEEKKVVDGLNVRKTENGDTVPEPVSVKDDFVESALESQPDAIKTDGYIWLPQTNDIPQCAREGCSMFEAVKIPEREKPKPTIRHNKDLSKRHNNRFQSVSSRLHEVPPLKKAMAAENKARIKSIRGQECDDNKCGINSHGQIRHSKLTRVNFQCNAQSFQYSNGPEERKPQWPQGQSIESQRRPKVGHQRKLHQIDSCHDSHAASEFDNDSVETPRASPASKTSLEEAGITLPKWLPLSVSLNSRAMDENQISVTGQIPAIAESKRSNKVRLKRGQLQMRSMLRSVRSTKGENDFYRFENGHGDDASTADGIKTMAVPCIIASSKALDIRPSKGHRDRRHLQTTNGGALWNISDGQYPDLKRPTALPVLHENLNDRLTALDTIPEGASPLDMEEPHSTDLVKDFVPEMASRLSANSLREGSPKLASHTRSLTHFNDTSSHETRAVTSSQELKTLQDEHRRGENRHSDAGENRSQYCRVRGSAMKTSGIPLRPLHPNREINFLMDENSDIITDSLEPSPGRKTCISSASRNSRCDSSNRLYSDCKTDVSITERRRASYPTRPGSAEEEIGSDLESCHSKQHLCGCVQELHERPMPSYNQRYPHNGDGDSERTTPSITLSPREIWAGEVVKDDAYVLQKPNAGLPSVEIRPDSGFSRFGAKQRYGLSSLERRSLLGLSPLEGKSRFSPFNVKPNSGISGFKVKTTPSSFDDMIQSFGLSPFDAKPNSALSPLNMKSKYGLSCINVEPTSGLPPFDFKPNSSFQARPETDVFSLSKTPHAGVSPTDPNQKYERPSFNVLVTGNGVEKGWCVNHWHPQHADDGISNHCSANRSSDNQGGPLTDKQSSSCDDQCREALTQVVQRQDGNNRSARNEQRRDRFPDTPLTLEGRGISSMTPGHKQMHVLFQTKESDLGIYKPSNQEKRRTRFAICNSTIISGRAAHTRHYGET